MLETICPQTPSCQGAATEAKERERERSMPRAGGTNISFVNADLAKSETQPEGKTPPHGKRTEKKRLKKIKKFFYFLLSFCGGLGRSLTVDRDFKARQSPSPLSRTSPSLPSPCRISN